MSQEDVARASDLSVSTVSKLEQKPFDPSWSTVQKIAKALGVEVTAFLDDEPELKPRKPKK